MSNFKIKSYAKINIALNVTGKLKKYHKIESIVSFIDFHDLIYLKLINNKYHKVIFKGKFSIGIDKDNTVSNLLKILDQKKLLNNKKFEIKIIKNIPQKSGMGGGSMNAASLINFFVLKKIIKVKKDKLYKLCKLIGSDVILGINPKNCVLFSNGKIKKYKEKFKYFTLIVKPKFGCSTREIFSQVRSFSHPKFNVPLKPIFNKYYLKNLSNDLEPIVFRKYPKLKKIKLFLENIPNISFVRMSGSGSSIVAYFNSKKSCNNAINQFKRKFDSYWCISSKTI